MLSREFPKTHPKAGQPTDFKEKKEAGIKKHTIRGNVELWEYRAKEINAGRAELSVRQWSGKPYERGSHQIEIARHTCLGTQRVSLRYKYNSKRGYHLPISSKVTDSNGVQKVIGLDRLAANDGLSVEDFKEWFSFEGKNLKGVIYGVILHFTDMRY